MSGMQEAKEIIDQVAHLLDDDAPHVWLADKRAVTHSQLRALVNRAKRWRKKQHPDYVEEMSRAYCRGYNQAVADKAEDVRQAALAFGYVEVEE